VLSEVYAFAAIGQAQIYYRLKEEITAFHYNLINKIIKGLVGIDKKFAAKIKKLRKSKGITKEKFAHGLNISLKDLFDY